MYNSSRSHYTLCIKHCAFSLGFNFFDFLCIFRSQIYDHSPAVITTSRASSVRQSWLFAL